MRTGWNSKAIRLEKVVIYKWHCSEWKLV